MAFVNEHKNIFKYGILFISAIMGFLILYGIANMFYHAPLQMFYQHEQKHILVILCCVFISEWVALTNDILSSISPIALLGKKISFNLIDWRVGSVEIPNSEDPKIGIKARFFFAYPWCLLIVLVMIVKGLGK